MARLPAAGRLSDVLALRRPRCRLCRSANPIAAHGRPARWTFEAVRTRGSGRRPFTPRVRRRSALVSADQALARSIASGTLPCRGLLGVFRDAPAGRACSGRRREARSRRTLLGEPSENPPLQAEAWAGMGLPRAVEYEAKTAADASHHGSVDPAAGGAQDSAAGLVAAGARRGIALALSMSAAMRQMPSPPRRSTSTNLPKSGWPACPPKPPMT